MNRERQRHSARDVKSDVCVCVKSDGVCVCVCSPFFQLLEANCQRAVAETKLKETTLTHALTGLSVHSNQAQAL